MPVPRREAVTSPHTYTHMPLRLGRIVTGKPQCVNSDDPSILLASTPQFGYRLGVHVHMICGVVVVVVVG